MHHPRCILLGFSGRSLVSDRSMIHHTMYDTSIDVYPSLPVDLESTALVLATILLVVIVTAESDVGSGMQLTVLASYHVSYIYK